MDGSRPVAEEIKRGGTDLVEIGGAVHLASIINDYDIKAGAETYARVIRGKVCLREMVHMAHEITRICFGSEGA